jgi:hypothetical protein
LRVTGLLPPGFAALEPYIEHWIGRNAAERADLRGARPTAERDAFHAALTPLLQPGLALLDTKALANLDEAEQRLLGLLLSFVHVSLAVDIQGPDESAHTCVRSAMRIVRAPADHE